MTNRTLLRPEFFVAVLFCALGIPSGLADEAVKKRTRSGDRRMKVGRVVKREKPKAVRRDLSGDKSSRKEAKKSVRSFQPIPGNRPARTLGAFNRRPDADRMTVDLPEKYVDMDLDYDGQIGFYEWLTVKRSELKAFDAMDVDSDGMLTPRELQADAKAVGTGLSARYQSSRLVIVGGPFGSYGRRKIESLSPLDCSGPFRP